MELNKHFFELLVKLNLQDCSSLTAEQWDNLKKELSLECDKNLAEHKQLTNLLDLAYQEMHHLSELIKQRESQTEAIFNSSRDMIMTLDSNAQIIEYNQATQLFLELESEDILGKSLFKALRDGTLIKDLKQCFENPDGDFLTNYLNQPHEGTIINSNGRTAYASLYACRVRTGKSPIYPIYIKDLTAEKETEKALLEARSQFMIASKMSALGEMAGGVAHEINTPLAVIQMRTDHLLECLKDDSIDDEVLEKSLDVIDKTVKRISTIVNGLRSFARDSSKDPVSPHSFSKIVEDTFSLCREKFNNHGVQLEYVYDSDIIIECRPGEISQVLLNFLNNAYDAIQDLPEKWVKIEACDVWNYIQINIIDSGPGISLDIQEKIMQPFFTTKEVGKGTGLGLSISKGIVDSHLGKIQIDRSCKNTKFMIFLPKHKVEEKAS